MNAHTHLDLGDLIAGAAGQPVGDRARAHLAGCEHCQREANRWNLVAEGIRGLAADAPAPASGAAQPAQPHDTARPDHAGRPRRTWRRAVVVAGSLAAAVVLLGGIGVATGYVHVHLSGPGSQAALTAVTGCAQLQQADGTLERVDGTSLVIKTASGQAVTVTTAADTFVSMSGPLLGDITDGAAVTVHGQRSGGTIAAVVVVVGQPAGAVNPAGLVAVQGTVADAGTGGFTLVASGGTRVLVTDSASTLVVVPHARPGQLRIGASIFAVGRAGAGGTLAAQGVAAISQLASGRQVGVSVRDCSPSSVTAALGAISTAPLTGR